MSDYNQGPGGPYDKYGNGHEPVDSGGRGPYILLGILVAIGLIGGLLYFDGGASHSGRTNEARAPAVHLTAPATPAPAAPAPSDISK